VTSGRGLPGHYRFRAGVVPNISPGTGNYSSRTPAGRCGFALFSRRSLQKNNPLPCANRRINTKTHLHNTLWSILRRFRNIRTRAEMRNFVYLLFKFFLLPTVRRQNDAFKYTSIFGMYACTLLAFSAKLCTFFALTRMKMQYCIGAVL
jgi:hypothetical protein